MTSDASFSYVNKIWNIVQASYVFLTHQYQGTKDLCSKLDCSKLFCNHLYHSRYIDECQLLLHSVLLLALVMSYFCPPGSLRSDLSILWYLVNETQKIQFLDFSKTSNTDVNTLNGSEENESKPPLFLSTIAFKFAL